MGGTLHLPVAKAIFGAIIANLALKNISAKVTSLTPTTVVKYNANVRGLLVRCNLQFGI